MRARLNDGNETTLVIARKLDDISADSDETET